MSTAWTDYYVDVEHVKRLWPALPTRKHLNNNLTDDDFLVFYSRFSPLSLVPVFFLNLGPILTYFGV